MRIFFEDYVYPSSQVEPYIDKAYLSYLKDDRVSISCVGYYFSSKANDTVFILPKVFINVVQEDDGIKELAFGKFNPLDISDTSRKENPLLKSEYFNQIFNLSTWIYRAIVRFKERNPESQIAVREEMRNVNNVKGSESETWIDIILRLIRFNSKHRTLFTYIAKINSQGLNKINWRKTMSSVTPIMQDNSPIYLKFRNKTKVVNFDEELLVLFYSVLDYLHTKYNFKILRNLNYTTDPKGVEKLIKSGKGTRLLKSIRKKYFKDELVELWNLLYVFFQKAQFVSSKGTHKEFLIARDFNIIFEDMIDSIISDDTKITHEKLKDQPEGKVVDHIYRYNSLINANEKYKDIYYIGDSKYYKEGNDPGENSIFKQFTYVRNVIQMNMDIWKPSNNKEISRHNYYDENTEGYNITPNFFIRGKINPDKIDYNDAQLVAETDNNGKVKVERKIHHHNRIFDRDTLFVQKYDINFLYVLTAYAQNHRDDSYKKRIREKFRMNLLNWLSDNYRFLLLTPKDKDKQVSSLEKHFHKVLGKVYSYGDGQYLMGLDLGKNESNSEEQLHRWEEDYEVWKSLEEDFKIELFDIKTSIAKGVYNGERLGSIVEDSDVAKDLNELQTFNQPDILSRIIDKYGRKYFGMDQNDWRKIINDYYIVRPSATMVNLQKKDNEDISMAAEKNKLEEQDNHDI